jgi:hypothetical protein
VAIALLDTSALVVSIVIGINSDVVIGDRHDRSISADMKVSALQRPQQAEVLIDQVTGRLQLDWGSLLSTLSMQDVARLAASTEYLCAERT